MKRLKKLILPILFAGLVSTSCTVKPFDWWNLGFSTLTVSGIGTGLFSLYNRALMNFRVKNPCEKMCFRIDEENITNPLGSDLIFFNVNHGKYNYKEEECIDCDCLEVKKCIQAKKNLNFKEILKYGFLKVKETEIVCFYDIDLGIKKAESYCNKYRNIGFGIAAVGVVGFIGRTIYNRYSRSLVEDGI